MIGFTDTRRLKSSNKIIIIAFYVTPYLHHTVEEAVQQKYDHTGTQEEGLCFSITKSTMYNV